MPSVLKLADQMPIGAGLQIFPEKRFQIITEYDGLIYVGKPIQNTSFGARDPVDSVMGFRLYALKNLALDVGYRYNLNLTNHQDRNGFVVKIAFARWPEKPLPPDNVTASCSAEKSSVMEGSNECVAATATATDANGRPLNYTWTASGGNISGIGPYVRWDSRPDWAPGTTASQREWITEQAITRAAQLLLRFVRNPRRQRPRCRAPRIRRR